MTGRRSEVATIGLIVLFVTVFFSVFLQQIGAVLGWVTLALAARDGSLTTIGADGRGRGLFLPLAVFLGMSAVSAAFGEVPAAGWRIVGKETFAIGFVLLGLAPVAVGQVRVAVWAFLAMSAIAGAWSIYQVVFDYGGVFNYHLRTHGFWHRDAFISYANALAMTFALVLGLWFWGRSSLRRLGAVAAVFSIVGMVTSYTRASWLVAGAVLTAVSLVRRAIVPLAVVGVLLAAVIVLPADDYLTDLAGRARSSFDFAATTNVDRVVRYRVGLAIVEDYPVLGTGPAGVLAIYPKYALPGALDVWHLHNTFLQLLAERGPVGLVAWIWLVAAAIVRAFRVGSRGSAETAGVAMGIGLLLCSVLLLGIFNYLWEDWRMRSVMLAFIGLAWSPALESPTPRQEKPVA